MDTEQSTEPTLNDYDADFLRELYCALLLPRMVEEKMLLLLRQGRISKWFSGIGQEAISVGATAALEFEDYVLPMHRNLGVFTSRGVPLDRLFEQFQGKAGGFTAGRDRSFHFGTKEYHIVGMISHLGPQMGVANGIALSSVLSGTEQIALVFTGEGGTSQGDFHEALNVASVWNLPVIFLIENNGYGLSTPVSEQYRCERLSDRARGYGIPGITVDGNDILQVYATVRECRRRVLEERRPVLLECMTFRMRGHEEASGTAYVPDFLFAEWQKRDPLTTFEQRLIGHGVLSVHSIADYRAELDRQIDVAIESAFDADAVVADLDRECSSVYAPHHVLSVTPGNGPTSERRFVDAISDGLRTAMERHDQLVLMGQDIAEYGGVFKVTKDFIEHFGPDRVRNTPLCESAILGTALGLAVRGFKSMVEMQFADFVSSGFTQIVNNIAKLHYRWGQNVDVVVRMPTGAGVGAGPFHSQSNEAWFAHTPGLKVLYPATPYDAKGLLLAAIDDPNPILFFEHKLLYRSVKEDIPDEFYTVQIGKARIAREGTRATVVSYGMGVHWAQEYAADQPESDLEIVDLRSLVPLDFDTIASSVAKTGRVLVLHEDTATGGFGGELAALIGEHCFEQLDAPVMRCASLDTPVPFAKALEEQFLAKARLDQALERLLVY